MGATLLWGASTAPPSHGALTKCLGGQRSTRQPGTLRAAF